MQSTPRAAPGALSPSPEATRACLDPRTPWPFGPLTEQQQRQRDATERAMRAHRLRVFRSFDDTVAGGLS